MVWTRPYRCHFDQGCNLRKLMSLPAHMCLLNTLYKSSRSRYQSRLDQVGMRYMSRWHVERSAQRGMRGTWFGWRRR